MKRTFKTGCPRCFKVLSTEVRAQIIEALSGDGEQTVSAIVRRFRLKQPTISYHLSELEKTGWVTSRGRGRFVYYKLNPYCREDRKRCLLLD